MTAAVATPWEGIAEARPRDGQAKVLSSPPAVVARHGVAPTGPRGPAGPQGQSAGLQHNQTDPAATWIIPHALGRAPNVAVYLTDGQQIDADVWVSAESVSIIFPEPMTGFAVLN